MSQGTIHASAVLVGARALLVRGGAGSGKSRLVLAILAASEAKRIPFARLVADDRVLLEVRHERLLASPAPALAGLIEVRGYGIVRLPHEPLACVGLVVDLAQDDGGRLPDEAARRVRIEGVVLPRLPVAAGYDPLPPVLAATARLWNSRTETTS